MIRATTLNDIPTIQQIAQVSWNDTYKDIIPENIQKLFLEKAYSPMMIAKRIEKTIFLIAEYKGEAIGFANFTYVDEDGDAELTAIYVLPEFQKMGYGRKLLEAGVNHMSIGKQLFVYVESKNERARIFYEHYGFECLEEFDEYFEGHPLSTAKYLFPLKTPAY
ncbi:GNAT family N-acetyltransferase [Psychrobacillus sp. BL-248-WT-3]|uniref:GNAT family N-acetyltransferase n=1 Tax=Psychrobacillus sp. BL-248-WT-3 TaxID=2725306 RepID=UPI00146E4288|nr:GNAT family N-acetyltransferase [Psychrobacillus sp. BL-248-WT-3]NME07668.1 GNAT family N-acetyltransferase [Psychrobacillus sp. BL-248-WT-3]